MTGSSTLKVALLTAVAMLAFAANSVLNRLALAQGEADAVTYTGVRLASGALVLGLLLALRGAAPRLGRIGGSRGGAVSLCVYAIAFSFAYLQLGAGTGALLLFASVQIGMLGWAIRQGDRPGGLEAAGFALAILFLALLLMPGLTAPDPLGALLMVLAGLAWAAFTLIGRGSTAPLVDTAGNFLRCLPLALRLTLAVLTRLGRSAAAYVQLTVPALAAAGGVLFIAEPLTLRLALCSAGILGGVGLALWGAEARRRRG